MRTLLNKYRANPSDKKAETIRRYYAKHSFSCTFLSADDTALLKAILSGRASA
jgi:hypothetical protein